MKSENIKDRDSKIAFLQKVIDVVSKFLKINFELHFIDYYFLETIPNEPTLSVKPSKIVAGHEPEQTNLLLQRIAFVISHKVNISPVTNGKVSKDTPKKDESPTKPKTRKSSDPKPKVSRTVSKEETKPSKAKSISKNSSKDGSQYKKPKKIEKQKTIREKTVELTNSLESGNLSSIPPDASLEAQVVEENKTLEPRKKSGDRKSSSGDSRKSSAEKNKTTEENSRKNKTSEERKSSGRKKSGTERKLSIPEEPPQIENDDTKQLVHQEEKKAETEKVDSLTNIVSPEKKLESLQEEPPKLNKIQETPPEVPPPLNRQNSILNRPRTSLRPPSARPPSARPGAPRRRDKSIEIVLQPNEPTKIAGINVKLESELEDDGENLLVIENSNVEDEFLGNKNVDHMIIDEDNQQGHLVKQILETQKELVQGEKSDIEKAIKDRKNRQTSASQLDSLRLLIQSLTKAVNPTGKLLDYIPEDIDSMQLELTMWRDNYSQAAAELRREMT